MKRKIISSNYDPIDLLWEYTLFLQKEGYLDTDATSEEPTALDQFMSNKAIDLIKEEKQTRVSEQFLKKQSDWLMLNTTLEVEKIVDFVEMFKKNT